MRQRRRFTRRFVTNRDVRRSVVDPTRSSTDSVSHPSEGVPQRVKLRAVLALSLCAAVAPGCSHELDTERTAEARGSVGEEMYGVICDRVGAQALREDLTGESFRNVCHRSPGGEFSDEVDQSKLPAMDPEAVDVEGNPVSVEKQREDRDRAVGRIQALARRRRDVIRALDATFPDVRVPVKDLDNPDPTESCKSPKKGEGLLTHQLADMLGRMGALYNDDTIPHSTQSLARVVEAFKASPEAQTAWTRLSAREGYRPIETALGAARPIVSYPRLRDVANASLRLLSADSNPYAFDAKFDADGRRIPVPGPGNAALNKMLEAAHEELLEMKVDPQAPPLVVNKDAQTGRQLLSRPRENLEVMQELLFTWDPAFGGADAKSRFIVRRDRRGYAALAGGVVRAPFVDADKDGLPDVDELGRFVTADRSTIPSPFAVATAEGGSRDALGRAVAGDSLLYDYLDTSHTFVAQTLLDARALSSPDLDKDALQGALGGLHVAVGPRTRATKTYRNKTLQYDGIDVAKSPLLDLVHALGVVLSDRNADATLALVRELFVANPSQMARMTGAILQARNIANAHEEAKIPREATFWDENLELMGEVAKVRGSAPGEGLLEDILRALAAPETAELGNSLSQFAAFRDQITYNRNDVNGPPFNMSTGSLAPPQMPVDRDQPLTGNNRSIMYRFLQTMADTDGVTACNKPDAVVHATLGPINVRMPIGSGGYQECEVFKVGNLAEFYVSAIAEAHRFPWGKGAFYLRNDTLRDGILGIGAATVGLMENSSGLSGYWTPEDSRVLAPKPEYLNRLVFFDLANDSPSEGLLNFKTNRFIRDLQGTTIGTAVCPERVISDPIPSAPDASPDGLIHGLRNCAEGQWLQQRGKDALFPLEHYNFFRTIKPLAEAFAKYGREDLFVKLNVAIYKHWPGAEATSADCQLATGPCPRSGMNSYEGLLAEVFATDVFPALSELARALQALQVQRCAATDPTTKACTSSTTVSGLEIAAESARATMDPDYARNVLRLMDRHGRANALRNDGTMGMQVTPAYLVANALAAVDKAFDDYEAQHPEEPGRRADWRKARSVLADQFLGTTGIRSTSSFSNPSILKMTPMLVDMLRGQLLAHCPQSFTPPYDQCQWAREELAKKAEQSLGGPLVGSGLTMMDAIRRDPEGRRQMALMTQYLLDAASDNDALASMLASANDIVQLLQDEENLVPLLHVMAQAMDASERDASGRITKKSLVDAQMALVARISGKYYDRDGQEICAKEVDPNQVLAVALGNLLRPIKDGELKGQSPLDVLVDVVADVNRVDPTQTYTGKLAKTDYDSVSRNVVEFLSDKERGLEQFYEVIRNGTR